MKVASRGKNSYGRLIYIFFHEQALYERGTKWKKVYLTSVRNVAMWLYRSVAESEKTFLLFKEQG